MIRYITMFIKEAAYFLIILSPCLLMLYLKYGSPSEGFLLILNQTSNFIALLAYLIAVTFIAMSFYVSPNECKRRNND